MPGSGERIGAFEAKTQLPRLLRRVQAGERFIITRHGRPVAELVPYVGPGTGASDRDHRPAPLPPGAFGAPRSPLRGRRGRGGSRVRRSIEATAIEGQSWPASWTHPRPSPWCCRTRAGRRPPWSGISAARRCWCPPSGTLRSATPCSLVAVRRGRMRAEEAQEALDLLASLPIEAAELSPGNRCARHGRSRSFTVSRSTMRPTLPLPAGAGCRCSRSTAVLRAPHVPLGSKRFPRAESRRAG